MFQGHSILFAYAGPDGRHQIAEVQLQAGAPCETVRRERLVQPRVFRSAPSSQLVQGLRRHRILIKIALSPSFSVTGILTAVGEWYASRSHPAFKPSGVTKKGYSLK